MHRWASEGLMGVAADAALAAGGVVTGIMPRGLAAEEPPHDGISELRLVGTRSANASQAATLCPTCRSSASNWPCGPSRGSACSRQRPTPRAALVC